MAEDDGSFEGEPSLRGAESMTAADAALYSAIENSTPLDNIESSETPPASSEESIVTSIIQSDLAARVIQRLEKERAAELRLKKKIMNDMISSVHEDTTQFILDQAEAALINVREFIEEFFKYKGPSGLLQLWEQVQQLLDMLEPFTQLPGIVIPGVGDVGQMVNDFVRMQKIIYENLTEEEKAAIRKQVEDEKKKKKDPGFWKKAGKEIEEQADQTWEAVQILIDEIPRIKEDLYMMCLENAWGLIVKVCKLLGIPIDVFPFNLLAELPEINRLARDLRRNGKKMLKDAFGEMMLPLYLAHAMSDSWPIANEKKLSVVCMELAQNGIEMEFQEASKKLADLKIRKARCEEDIKETNKKLKSLEKRMAIYDSGQFPQVEELIQVAQQEGEERLAVLSADVERTEEKIPNQQMLVNDLSGRVDNREEIMKIAQPDYDAATKQIAKKNEEVKKAKEAIEADKAKRRICAQKTTYCDNIDAIQGASVTMSTDDGSFEGEPSLRGAESMTAADAALYSAMS